MLNKVCTATREAILTYHLFKLIQRSNNPFSRLKSSYRRQLIWRHKKVLYKQPMKEMFFDVGEVDINPKINLLNIVASSVPLDDES